MEKEKCLVCGKLKEEHYGLKGKLYCENLDFYDEKSKRFKPKEELTKKK